VPDTVPEGAARYRPQLPAARVTQRTAYDHAAARTQAASGVLAQDPRTALPATTLAAGFEIWEARRDLLASDRFATDFVVETETDGRAFVRFGDGIQGRKPSRGTRFTLAYREGGGAAGNVGADTLFHVVTSAPVASLRNPLPASGGQDPESIAAVRLAAPVAFRSQERSVTRRCRRRRRRGAGPARGTPCSSPWTGAAARTSMRTSRTSCAPSSSASGSRATTSRSTRRATCRSTWACASA
jgi:hypothetical protein